MLPKPLEVLTNLALRNQKTPVVKIKMWALKQSLEDIKYSKLVEKVGKIMLKTSYLRHKNLPKTSARKPLNILKRLNLRSKARTHIGKLPR